MKKHHRTCSICGKKHARTSDYEFELKARGIKGYFAAPECMELLAEDTYRRIDEGVAKYGITFSRPEPPKGS
jgi:uncharacterized protein YlaI